MISDLNILREKDFLVNYRSATTNVTEKNIINSRVWLQTAINIGRKKNIRPFDAKKLKSYIPEIRSMTVESPNVFLPRLNEIFEDCGVTFVLLPYLKNSGITGAVKWINSNKVILALNDRRNFADGFWFSMFHEIKHVLQQKIKTTFISQEKKNMDIESLNENLEKEADDFARTILIPKDEYDAFISRGNFSDNAICLFSRKINIQPGIVLGRLQHDGYVALNRGTNLKIKYKIIGCQEDKVDFVKTLLISCLPAIITALISYLGLAKKYKSQIKTLELSNKQEIDKLMNQHKIDIDSLNNAHILEMEKLEADHKNRSELMKLEMHMLQKKVKKNNPTRQCIML